MDDDLLGTSFEYLDLAQLAKDFPEYLSALFMARLEQAATVKDVKCLVRAMLLCAQHGVESFCQAQPLRYLKSCGFFDIEHEVSLDEDGEAILKAVEHQLGIFENPEAY